MESWPKPIRGTVLVKGCEIEVALLWARGFGFRDEGDFYPKRISQADIPSGDPKWKSQGEISMGYPFPPRPLLF